MQGQEKLTETAYVRLEWWKFLCSHWDLQFRASRHTSKCSGYGISWTSFMDADQGPDQRAHRNGAYQGNMERALTISPTLGFHVHGVCTKLLCYPESSHLLCFGVCSIWFCTEVQQSLHLKYDKSLLAQNIHSLWHKQMEHKSFIWHLWAWTPSPSAVQAKTYVVAHAPGPDRQICCNSCCYSVPVHMDNGHGFARVPGIQWWDYVSQWKVYHHNIRNRAPKSTVLQRIMYRIHSI